MKIWLFLFINCSLFTGWQSPTGKWKLNRIETSGGVLLPEEGKYRVQFSPKGLTFNLAVNTCRVDSFSISKKRIRFFNCNCTKMCCDGNSDSISNYIDYSGYYHVKGDSMIIENSKGKLFLSR